MSERFKSARDPDRSAGAVDGHVRAREEQLWMLRVRLPAERGQR
jgi:hypothetical protein